MKKDVRLIRGSVTVITAIIISAVITLMSGTQTVMNVLAGKSLEGSLVVKTGKRSNSNGFALADALFNSRVIDYVTWRAGEAPAFFPTIPSTATWSYSMAGGKPSIVMPGCNYRTIPAASQSLYSARQVLNPTICDSNDTGLDSTVTLGAISNGGLYTPGKPFFVSLSGKSSVAILPAAIGPKVVLEDARLDLPPPIPRCTMTANPLAIAQGQTTTLTVATSLNTYTVTGGNYPGTPVSSIDTDWTPSVLTVSGGNNPAVITSPLTDIGARPVAPTLAAPQTRIYTTTVNGPGGASKCSVAVTVFPRPQCKLRAEPPQILVGRSTTIIMETSNNAFGRPYAPTVPSPLSPTYSAVLVGTALPVAADGTTNGGAKVVTPPGIGTFTYNGSVTGVNGSTASCSTAVPVFDNPRCAISANPGSIQQGNVTTLALATNSGSTPIRNSQILSGSNTLIASFGPTGGATVYFPPVAGVYGFLGQAFSNVDGSAGNCATNLVVTDPPCRFSNPAYYETTGTPVGTGYEGINLMATSARPALYQVYPHVCTDPSPINGLCYGGLGMTGENTGDDYCAMVRLRGADGGHYCDLSYYLKIVRVHGANNRCYAQVLGARPANACFSPETRILLADGTYQRIDQIWQGAMIWNPIRQRAYRVTRVVWGYEKVGLFEVRYGDSVVRASHRHPFLTSRGLVAAEELDGRDAIMTSDGMFHRVDSVRQLRAVDKQTVWNVELDTDSQESDDHLVVAEGVVTGELFLQKKFLK